MKRRTLFAVALSGILLRASEVLGIEEIKIGSPKFDPQTYMGDWKWVNIPHFEPFSEFFRLSR